MKTTKLILVLLSIAFFSACAQKSVVSDIPPGPGDNLFMKAEKKFASKSYDKALSIYESYLDQYFNMPLAPAALLKIGAIYNAKGDYQKAREAYLRLTKSYEGSSYAGDAMVDILITYFNEGKYEDVVRYGYEVPEDMEPNGYVVRKYSVMGDAYVALGQIEEAVDFYLIAYKRADNLQAKSIEGNLRKAVRKLSTDEVVSMLRITDEDILKGYLVYQLGENYAAEDKNEDALKVLKQFLKLFPDHEYLNQALALIEKIKTGPEKRTYTIGCLLPFTGQYKVLGQGAEKSILLALNKYSSVPGNPLINVIFRDTGSDEQKAADAVKELAEEGVTAIIGPIGNVGPAADEAQARNIPIITLTGKNEIPEKGEYVFRNFLTDKMQAKSLASYAFDVLGISDFAILYPEERYGNVYMNMFWDEIIERGGQVVGIEAYDTKHTDFADPIKKLIGLFYEIPEDLREGAEQVGAEGDALPETEGDVVSEQPEETEEDNEPYEQKAIVDFDAVFIPDGVRKAGLIIPQLAYYDIDDVYLLGTNLWHNDALIKMAKPHVQNAIMTDGFFAESSKPNVRDFVRGFNETFGEKPKFVEAITFDTAMLLFELLRDGDVYSPAVLKDKLLGMEQFEGVTGTTSFDEKGDVQKDLYVLKVEGRRFVETAVGGKE